MSSGVAEIGRMRPDRLWLFSYKDCYCAASHPAPHLEKGSIFQGKIGQKREFRGSTNMQEGKNAKSK
jgi:hypothetical protein